MAVARQVGRFVYEPAASILASNLNPSDVLIADTIVFTRSALTDVEEWLS